MNTVYAFVVSVAAIMTAAFIAGYAVVKAAGKISLCEREAKDRVHFRHVAESVSTGSGANIQPHFDGRLQ